METTRKYNFKDVDMLLASKTLVQSLCDNLAELSAVRNNWTEDYVKQLGKRIDDAIDKYLGLDKKRELREATMYISCVQTPARQNLSFFKAQIEVDYRDDRVKLKKILKGLGFLNNYRAVQKGRQEATIQMLYAFKKGMTEKLKSEILAKGVNIALIDRIIEYANRLLEAEISQETLKETTKIISAETIQVFNKLYDEVTGICKIASHFYQHDPLKKRLFTFSKLVSNMNGAKNMPRSNIEAA
jgi:hypothetical protein